MPAGRFSADSRKRLLERLADRDGQLADALDLAFELVAGHGGRDARRACRS